MILTNSLVVFSLSILGHIFNYLFHLISGRLLQPEQYGLLEGFMALNYFIAVIISSFSLTIINSAQKIPLKQLQTLSLKLTLIIWLIFMALYPLISVLLKFDNFSLFFIFSLQIIFAFIPTLYLGYLQAKLNFKIFGLINLSVAFIKVFIALILLLLGFKIFGALISLVISNLALAIFSYLAILPHLSKQSQLNSKNNLKKFWSFSRLSFITQLGLTSLYVTDILLVRFLFPVSLSGIYAAASVIGKIIFFVNATVLTVSFPVFTQQKTALIKLKSSFLQAALLMVFICLIGLLSYWLFPDFIINLFYGPAYQTAGPLLFIFAVFMVIFSLFNLNLQFLLAVSKNYPAWIAGLTAIFQIGLIINYHADLSAIIYCSILASSLGLLFSSYFVIKHLNAKT